VFAGVVVFGAVLPVGGWGDVVLMALPSFRTVDPGGERLVRLSFEDCHETAPLPGSGEGLTSRRV
jgi:hypothetical protein